MPQKTAKKSFSIPPEIKPGQSIELLKELHILTRDGQLNQDSRRKLKQVYHLAQLIEPLLENLNKQADFTLVDHGAGKSYLGFILYDLFFKAQAKGQIIGVETRAELVEKSQQLAQKLHFERMQFINLSVAASLSSHVWPDKIDLVTALHACDTATDDAIAFALQKCAQSIVLVPCCQAEVAAVLRNNKKRQMAASSLAEIWRHPLHTREFGSHITNVLRCLQLEMHGYQVTVTELVGWEHSMKNELIMARRIPTSASTRLAARAKLTELLSQLGLNDLQSRFAYCLDNHG